MFRPIGIKSVTRTAKSPRAAISIFQRFFSSFAGRIWGLCILLLLVTVISISLVIASQVRQSMSESLGTKAVSELQLRDVQVREYLSKVYVKLNAVLQNPQLQSTDEMQVSDLLHGAVEDDANIITRQTFAIRKNHFLGAANPADKDVILSQPRWKAVLDGAAFVAGDHTLDMLIIDNPETDGFSVSMQVWVQKTSPEFMVVGTEVKFDNQTWGQAMWSKPTFDLTTEAVYLFTQDGHGLVELRKPEKAGGLNGVANGMLLSPEIFTDRSHDPVYLAAKASSKESGWLETTRGSVPVQASYLKDVDLGWTFGMEYPMSDITAPINAVINQIWLVSLFLFLFSAIIALLVGRLMTKPLIQLGNEASRIANGDLTKSIVIRSRDEIGRLADSFRTMEKRLRELVGRVSTSSEGVVSASVQMYEGAGEVAQAISEVVGSVSQISVSMEQESKISSDIAKTMDQMENQIHGVSSQIREAATYAVEASQRSLTSQEAMVRVEAQMNKIRSTADQTAESMKELSSGSAQIEKMVELIKDIAEQTNLLALNAAIEAARAGDAGSGFKVVASEVRKLAEQSNQATIDIARSIQTTRAEISRVAKASEQSVKEARHGEQILQEIRSVVLQFAGDMETLAGQVQTSAAVADQMSTDIHEVAELATGGAARSEEATSGVHEIIAATEEVTAHTQQMLSSSESLHQLANELKESVAVFKL